MPSRFRRPGEFCWINILSPDPDAARAFFSDILGWSWGEIPGMGHFMLVDGHRIGGLFDLAGPQVPAGTPPAIGVMVRVDDADATSARAAVLGGTGKPAFDIGDQGRMAECTDPTGAMFDLWQPGVSEGTDVDPMAHGAPSWFETLTSDATVAGKFYADLFGWRVEATDVGSTPYFICSLGEENVAGMMQITPEMGQFPPHWGVYFTVNDVDATAARAAELGGRVPVPPMDLAEVGRFAGITSPQGVMFHVIRYLWQ